MCYMFFEWYLESVYTSRHPGMFAIFPSDAIFDAAFNYDGRSMARRCTYPGTFNNAVSA